MAQTSLLFRPCLNNHQSILHLIFTLILQINPVTTTLCYTPNGTVSNDRPCDASASASVCCTQGFLCTSNKLCQPADWWDGTGGNPLQFIRGTCTDQTWAAPECQGHCVAESPGGGEWVMRCGNHSDSYCCSAGDCCTRASFIKFSMDEPTITATAGIEPTTAGDAVTTTSSIETLTESSISSVTTITSTSTASIRTFSSRTSETFTGFSTTSPSTVQTQSEPESPTDSSTTKQSKPTTKTTTAIGIGVGVGVGIVLLAIIAGLIYFHIRRKRKMAAKEAAALTMSTQTPAPRGGSEIKYLRQVPLGELETRRPLETIAELDGGNFHGYGHWNANGRGRGRATELE